jgi:L-amino acid N-acyltransferase YncA
MDNNIENNCTDNMLLAWALIQLTAVAFLGVLRRRRNRRGFKMFGVHPINRRRNEKGMGIK